MPPTIKETVIALFGAVLLLIATPWIILGVHAEFATILYVVDQVRR